MLNFDNHSDLPLLIFVHNKSEIIGNIFENSELLN